MLHFKRRNPRRLRELTEEQKHMYQSEQLMNFRWIAKLCATRSPYTLSARDLVPWDVHLELTALGQFAEVAYGIVDLGFVFANLKKLSEPDFPLEGYSELEGAELVQTLHGTSANFQGYVAYRRQSKQLIIAFSGTRTPSQALLDCHFFQRPHPIDPRCRVHRGFWRLYKGISKQALASLMKVSAEGYDVTELVITGHSMGGAVSYLLAIDLLSSPEVLPSGLVLKIAVFGAPRVGNRHLVEFWQTLTSTFRARRGQNALVEYAVKAYNDGVPALPPVYLGYRHFCRSPMYFVNDRLYHVPESEVEHALFRVAEDQSDEDRNPPQFPWGGHNYYNGRNMEKLTRRMEWVSKMMAGETDWDQWKELYKQKVTQHERRDSSV